MNTRRLATVLLLGAAAALAANAAQPQVPKVMGDAPADKGAWRMEMLEARGAGAEQMQQMKSMAGAMTVCQTAAQAMARDDASGRQSQCASKLVEDSATRAVMEMSCPGNPPSTTRSTITRAGAKAWEVLIDQNEGGQARTMRMRMSYAGPCSEKDSVMSYQKDSPACRNMQAQMAQMDPGKQCKGAGREQCLKAMADARAQMAAMCK